MGCRELQPNDCFRFVGDDKHEPSFPRGNRDYKSIAEGFIIYDYMGRRVEKKVYSGSAGNWSLEKHERFVYDGYEQIEKLDALNSNAIRNKRIWGKGKIIADIHGSNVYYALGDANKNRAEYIDSSGTIQGHYEYSPFGKITVKNGTLADDFDYRFSSEVFDSESGLVYYNYRYYSPELGRWLSRDPIAEEGGFNLYEMVGNGVVNWLDRWGLMGIGGGTPFPLLYYRLPSVPRPSHSACEIDKRFKELNCILKKLIQFVKDKGADNIEKILGASSENFSHDWNTYVLPAANYYFDNYSSPSNWAISDNMDMILDAMKYNPFGDVASAFNFGLDVTISQSLLFGDRPLDAINALIHEPQHDFSQRWLGHKAVIGYSKELECSPLTEVGFLKISRVTENWGEKLGKALNEARIIAELTPIEACCIKAPNKGKKINNILQSIYCDCGNEY